MKYNEIAEERGDTRHKTRKEERASIPLPSEEGNNKKISDDQSENRRSEQGPQCHACYRYGHNIVRFCRKRGAEAPGRSQDTKLRL